MTTALTIDPRRGEIWLVDFDPAVGAEQRKLRPAVVLSLPSIGKLPLRIVVPVTSWKDRYRRYPWFVPLPATSENGLDADSGADAFSSEVGRPRQVSQPPGQRGDRAARRDRGRDRAVRGMEGVGGRAWPDLRARLSMTGGMTGGRKAGSKASAGP